MATTNNGSYFDIAVTTLAITDQGGGFLDLDCDVTFTVTSQETFRSYYAVELRNSSGTITYSLFADSEQPAVDKTIQASATDIKVEPGTYTLYAYTLPDNGFWEGLDAWAESDAVVVVDSPTDPFTRTLLRRIPLGRELTWREGDTNIDIIDDRTVALKLVVDDHEIRVTANRADLDILLAKDLVEDGRNDDFTLNGTLYINGDIVQDGGSYVTEVEEVKSQNDKITLRDGAATGLPAGEYSGFLIKLYDGLVDALIAIGNDGVLRIGDVGDEQTVATREDAPTDTALAFWNDTLKEFVTAAGLKWDGTTLLADKINVGNGQFSLNSNGKPLAPKTLQALTPAAIVNVDFSQWKLYTLTLDQDTIINITGTYNTGDDPVVIIVQGDYLLKFVQSGFTFKGRIDSNGVLKSYNNGGIGENYIQISCMDSDNDTFVVINAKLYE